MTMVGDHLRRLQPPKNPEHEPAAGEDLAHALTGLADVDGVARDSPKAFAICAGEFPQSAEGP